MKCDVCGRQNDANTQITGAPGEPDPGSILICSTCGEITQVIEDGKRERASKELIRSISRSGPGEERAMRTAYRLRERWNALPEFDKIVSGSNL